MRYPVQDMIILAVAAGFNNPHVAVSVTLITTGTAIIHYEHPATGGNILPQIVMTPITVSSFGKNSRRVRLPDPTGVLRLQAFSPVV
ncbi:MAG: hypothetical protein Kow0077_07250 [Anaerolineae bacterium]